MAAAEIISIDRRREMEATWEAHETEQQAETNGTAPQMAQEANPLDLLAAEIVSSPTFSLRGSRSKHGNDPNRKPKIEAEEGRKFFQQQANAMFVSQFAGLERA